MQLDYAIDILFENRRVTGREERCKKVEGPGITIFADERCLIQKRVLSTILEVFRPRGSTLRNERSPRGYLRKPLERTIISTQAGQSRILLAYNAEGHASLCQVLRQVLEVQQFHQVTIRRADPHGDTLAVRSMEARYHGPILGSDQAVKVFGSWHRLFH